MEAVETFFSEALSGVEDDIALEAVSKIDLSEALNIFPEIKGLEGIALEAVGRVGFSDALGKPISFLVDKIQAFEAERVKAPLPKGDYREVKMGIVSIGRKWIKGTYPGKTFKYEILKNNISESFEVGQQYTFDAVVEDKSTKYGKKIVVTPIDTGTKERIKEETNEPEVERWLRYVEDYVDKGDGYLYPKGMEKLKELGVEKYPELQKRLDEAIEKASEDKKQTIVKRLHKTAKDYLGYIDENIEKYWYNKGEKRVLETIGELDEVGENTTSYKSDLDDLKERFRLLEEEKEVVQKEKPVEPQEAGKEIYFIGGGEGYGYTQYKEGTVVRNEKSRIEKGEPEFLYILSASKEYYRDEGMSFGVGDEQGYVYHAKAREATEEESSKLRGEIKKEDEEVRQQRKLNSIMSDIRKNGEFPEKGKYGYPEGEVYADTINIHGSGSSLVIAKDYIWYVENNSMDGDDWSRNNISGSLAWRVPYDKELANQIKHADSVIYA